MLGVFQLAGDLGLLEETPPGLGMLGLFRLDLLEGDVTLDKSPRVHCNKQTEYSVLFGGAAMRAVTQERALATRDRIIGEAAQLFALKGYHDTKLEEILQALQEQFDRCRPFGLRTRCDPS